MPIYLRLSVPLLLLIAACSTVFAQTSTYVYRDNADSSRNCYLLVMPDRHDNESVKGLVVRDFTRLPDTSAASPFQLTELLNNAGWAVLYTATSTVYPDLYYDDAQPALLDTIIHEVLTTYGIDPSRIVIGGISASGTRALRYAQWCEQRKSPFGHFVAAVFAVDPPLDLERFYRSAQRIVARNIPNPMLDEARLMLDVLPRMLGGSPDAMPSAYADASVYSSTAPDGGNARWLVNLPVRFYHEPDVDWWQNERAAEYDDINSYDIVGCVAQIGALGGTSVELITTTGKGFDRNGNRMPHSWTIVDEEELVEWISAVVCR